MAESLEVRVLRNVRVIDRKGNQLPCNCITIVPQHPAHGAPVLRGHQDQFFWHTHTQIYNQGDSVDFQIDRAKKRGILRIGEHTYTLLPDKEGEITYEIKHFPDYSAFIAYKRRMDKRDPASVY